MNQYLPKTNIAPAWRPSEKENPFSSPSVSGAMLVSGRVPFGILCLRMGVVEQLTCTNQVNQLFQPVLPSRIPSERDDDNISVLCFQLAIKTNGFFCWQTMT